MQEVQCRGFINSFSQRATDFHRLAKTFSNEILYKTNFPLDHQTRWAKSVKTTVCLENSTK